MMAKKWSESDRGLLLRAICKEVQSQTGVEAVKEYRFHPVRKWRFDVAFPAVKVAWEIEGGVWTYGRHNNATGFLKDCEKYNTAVSMGWRILRSPWEWAQDGTMLPIIIETVRANED